jgi:hypothetical protein
MWLGCPLTPTRLHAKESDILVPCCHLRHILPPLGRRPCRGAGIIFWQLLNVWPRNVTSSVQRRTPNPGTHLLLSDLVRNVQYVLNVLFMYISDT